MSRATRLTAQLLKDINKGFMSKPEHFRVVNENGLLSALDKPGNKEHYDPNSTIAQRAASLSSGLIRNHPFGDANKRTAEEAADIYLREHKMPGIKGNAKIEEAHRKHADNKLSEEQLAAVYESVIGK